MKKAKITSVLSKRYKVVMLEGIGKGTTHKYPHDKVSAIEFFSQPLEAEEPRAEPASANGETRVEAITKEIEELWE